MSQTEFVMTTLNMEKEELQKSLDQSKQLMVANDDSKQLKEELVQKTQLLDEIASEKMELETSMEELDAQHQEAMNQVIAIRNDLFGKVENLQTNVQELNEIRDKLTEQIKSQKSQIKDLTEANDELTEKACLYSSNFGTFWLKIEQFWSKLDAFFFQKVTTYYYK